MSMDIYDRFRHNMQMLRTDRAISAGELSATLNMSPKRIADLEDCKGRGSEPKLYELEAICKFFDITLDNLVHHTASITFE